MVKIMFYLFMCNKVKLHFSLYMVYTYLFLKKQVSQTTFVDLYYIDKTAKQRIFKNFLVNLKSQKSLWTITC